MAVGWKNVEEEKQQSVSLYLDVGEEHGQIIWLVQA